MNANAQALTQGNSQLPVATKMSWLRILTHVALVLIGGWLCLYDATHRIGYPIIVGVLLLLLMHIVIAKDNMMQASIIITAGIIGAVAECVNISLGFYQYVTLDEQFKFLPTWVVLIWFLIGTTATQVNAVIPERNIAIFSVGILGACIFYLAGVKSGAVILLTSSKIAIGLMILVGSIAFLTIFKMSSKYVKEKHG